MTYTTAKTTPIDNRNILSPIGFKFAPPGPNNNAGVLGEKSTKLVETRNQPLTNPQCRPIQPNKDPLSTFLSNANT